MKADNNNQNSSPVSEARQLIGEILYVEAIQDRSVTIVVRNELGQEDIQAMIDDAIAGTGAVATVEKTSPFPFNDLNEEWTVEIEEADR